MADPKVPPIPERWDALASTDDDRVLGAAMTVHVGQAPPRWMSGTEALSIAEAERDRLRAWTESDDGDRRILLAVVFQALRRLLDRPSWVPRAARLDGGRIDLHIVVELYDDQVRAGEAATQTATAAQRAREGLATLVRRLKREDGADGTPAQDQ